MILAGYGYVGYVLYQRLAQIEKEIKDTTRRLNDAKNDPRTEYQDEVGPIQADTDLDPEPEPEPDLEPEPEPKAVETKQRGRKRGPKKVVFLDVGNDQPSLAEDKDTLVPSEER